MKQLISLLILLFSCFSPNLIAQDINAGRVAFYPFNGNANDAAGTNHGTVNGASLISDRFGNANRAFSFDGLDDYIEVAHNDLLNFGYNDNFSISFWVKVTTQANTSGNNDIISKWNANTSSGYPYAIRYYDDNGAKDQYHRKILCLRYDTKTCNNNPRVHSPCALPMEQWLHVVFRKTGEELTMFENGALVSTEVDATSNSCDVHNVSTIYFGRRAGNQRHFKGAIDDVSFYNRAITSEEARILFEENGWTAPLDSGKDTDFLSFSFPEQINAATINTTEHTIDITVKCQADLTRLTANFTLSEGATAEINNVNQVSGSTMNDFSEPVIYTITSKNTCYQQDWAVKVHLKSLDQNEIDMLTAFESFSFPEQTKAALINVNDHAISLEVKCNTDLSHLTASFNLPNGVEVVANGVEQVSGASENSFEKPVVYEVRNIEKCAVQQWTISVSFEQKQLKNILGGMIPNVITPNNDKANDTWKIVMDTETNNTHVRIFNRWGSLVFEDDNYKNNFGGENLRSSVYFYTITSKCSTSDQYKGWVHIIK